MKQTVMTVTIGELRTAVAIANTLLADPRPLANGWCAAEVRAFAARLTGAAYPKSKKGLRQAANHIERALELGLAAISEKAQA